MILRYVCWSFFLYLVLGPKVNSEITVDIKGYQNVLISFAPNIPSKDGEHLIKAIQGLLEGTSSVLRTAIGIPISSVTFRLPPSWSTETWKDISVKSASPAQTATTPDILVDGTQDSPFKNQPVSLQYGGCGVPGQNIILHRDFIDSAETFPKGKQLAREWLKYRYGVFEENGFTDDDFYPKFYRALGKSEIIITECTDPKVKYVFRKPVNDEACNMDSEIDFDYCIARPDAKSPVNITSSLMFFHKDIPTMMHLCGKNGHDHNKAARNKQNALCNGFSIWDVVKQSKDFQNIQKQPAPKAIQFSYVQETKPNFVVLLENSDNLREKEIPSLTRFALRRLYYDLQPKSKLAIYTYNSNVTEALPYIELPAKDRSDLKVIADFDLPAKSVCASCGLVKAMETLLQQPEVQRGSILLITASPLDKIPRISIKIRDSGICLHILRFTGEHNPYDKSYDPLALSFYCFSQQSIPSSLDSLQTFHSLIGFLKNDVPEFNDESEIDTVVSANMSAQSPVKIPQDGMASLYTLWLGKTLGSNNIECKSGGNVIALKPDTTGTDISSFTFNPVNADISCKLASDRQDPILTQVQKTARIGSHFVFDVWIHDISSEKEQLPILIFAKIYFGGYPVKRANVAATVSLGNKKEIVKLIDTGSGDPDITKYDGIYSGYFSNFLEAGNYEIRVKVSDTPVLTKAGKDYKFLVPRACCGSQIVSADLDIPSLGMEKVTVYTAKNKMPEDGYPPSRIINLQTLKADDEIVLHWTAPGGGKAVKYIIKLFVNKDDAITKFETAGQELNDSKLIPGATGDNDATVISSKDFDEDVTYYAAIRSLNQFYKPSEISNVLEFVPNPKLTTTTWASTTVDEGTTGGDTTHHDPPKSGNKTIAIVLGVLGGIAVLCILGFLGRYYYIKRTRQS